MESLSKFDYRHPMRLPVTFKHSATRELAYVSAILLSCWLLFFLGIGNYGLLDPGDAYFTEAAREMVESGNYIVPHLNYQIYFSKPILIYWLIAASYHLFGVNEFAGRFVSAAMATIMVLAVYFVGKCLSNRRTGLLAAAMLACAPLVVTFARMALIDMLFTSLLSLVLSGCLLVLFCGRPRAWPLIYVALGLAVLSKGPAAVVFFLLVVGAYILSRRNQWKQICSQLQMVRGALVTALVSLPWFVAVGLATDGLWTNVFIFYENLGRFRGKTNHHNGNLLYYIPVVGYGMFPWCAILPPALLAGIKSWMASFRSESTVSQSNEPLKDALAFLISWIGAIFLVFSLSKTKLDTYILPVFPALALMAGVWLDQKLVKPRSRYLTRFSTVMGDVGMFWVLIASIATFLMLNQSVLPSSLWQILDRIPVSTLWGVIVCVAIVGLGFVIQRALMRSPERRVQAISLMTATMMFCSAASAIYTFSVTYIFRQSDLHAVVTSLKDAPGSIAILDEFKPSVLFYVHRPVDSFFLAEQLGPKASHRPDMRANEPQYIITDGDSIDKLMSGRTSKLRLYKQSGDWYVFVSEEHAVMRLPTLAESFRRKLNLGGDGLSYGTLPFAGGTKTY